MDSTQLAARVLQSYRHRVPTAPARGSAIQMRPSVSHSKSCGVGADPVRTSSSIVMTGVGDRSSGVVGSGAYTRSPNDTMPVMDGRTTAPYSVPLYHLSELMLPTPKKSELHTDTEVLATAPTHRRPTAAGLFAALASAIAPPAQYPLPLSMATAAGMRATLKPSVRMEVVTTLASTLMRATLRATAAADASCGALPSTAPLRL